MQCQIVEARNTSFLLSYHIYFDYNSAKRILIFTDRIESTKKELWGIDLCTKTLQPFIE